MNDAPYEGDDFYRFFYRFKVEQGGRNKINLLLSKDLVRLLPDDNDSADVMTVKCRLESILDEHLIEPSIRKFYKFRRYDYDEDVIVCERFKYPKKDQKNLW